MTHIIYGIRHNGILRYVGLSGNSLAVRRAQHRKVHRRLRTPIYAEMRKFGFDAFEFFVIETCPSRATANDAEKRHIAINRATLLNVTVGGDGLDSETARRIGTPHLLAGGAAMRAMPGYRERNVAQIRTLTASLEFRARRSVDMRARHAADPTIIERIKAANRKRHADDPLSVWHLKTAAALAGLKRSLTRLENNPRITFAHPTINGRQKKTPRAEAIPILRTRIASLESDLATFLTLDTRWG